MKKLIIGFVLGAAFMVTGQAFADDISRFGKKIDGEAIVIKEGVEIGKAIITEGKSYVPAKDIAQAFGGDASYEKGVITITAASTEKEIKLLKIKQKSIEDDIKQTEEAIAQTHAATESVRGYLERNNPGKTDVINAKMAEHEAEQDKILAEYEYELEKLKSELAEINKQISALESAE